MANCFQALNFRRIKRCRIPALDMQGATDLAFSIFDRNNRKRSNRSDFESVWVYGLVNQWIIDYLFCFRQNRPDLTVIPILHEVPLSFLATFFPFIPTFAITRPISF